MFIYLFAKVNIMFRQKRSFEVQKCSFFVCCLTEDISYLKYSSEIKEGDIDFWDQILKEHTWVIFCSIFHGHHDRKRFSDQLEE